MTTADGEREIVFVNSVLGLLYVTFFMDLYVCSSPSALQAAHEKLHFDWKPTFPGHPVVQSAPDWLF